MNDNSQRTIDDDGWIYSQVFFLCVVQEILARKNIVQTCNGATIVNPNNGNICTAYRYIYFLLLLLSKMINGNALRTVVDRYLPGEKVVMLDQSVVLEGCSS